MTVSNCVHVPMINNSNIMSRMIGNDKEAYHDRTGSGNHLLHTTLASVFPCNCDKSRLSPQTALNRSPSDPSPLHPSTLHFKRRTLDTLVGQSHHDLFSFSFDSNCCFLHPSVQLLERNSLHQKLHPLLDHVLISMFGREYTMA